MNRRLSLPSLLQEVRACTLCAAHLPHGPRPVLQMERQARVVIIGQAPGTKVHQSGIPWDDPSGDHLREWLDLDHHGGLTQPPTPPGVNPVGAPPPTRSALPRGAPTPLGVFLDAESFYDPRQFAIMPMGFCYPGKKKGGDAPPRAECAPQWHGALLLHLPADALLILVGQYAQNFYLNDKRKKTLSDTVRAFEEYLPRYFPLPHPSWRSKIWIKKNPWFESELLPRLRDEIRARVGKHTRR